MRKPAPPEGLPVTLPDFPGWAWAKNLRTGANDRGSVVQRDVGRRWMYWCGRRRCGGHKERSMAAAVFAAELGCDCAPTSGLSGSWES
jgi:hypothetical protein